MSKSILPENFYGVRPLQRIRQREHGTLTEKALLLQMQSPIRLI